jgi:glycosyltransferase involved in cell wall biosynthesis
VSAPAAPDPDLRGLRIAIVNWRDPWHPEAGGAERYAWEIGRGLVARGATVHFLTARAPGQARRGRHDAITVTRLGGRFTVYPLVLGWLLAHRRSFDAVLDCQNGIPFFTPWALPRRVPVLCVMHHVHTVQFGMHFPRWMAWAGRILEGPVARRAYRRHACVAISPSTVTAMRERLGWTGDIYLVPPGAPAPAGAAAGPGAAATLSWVGRLVVHKRAELILPVARRLEGTGLVIDVVGRGPAAGHLAGAVAAGGLSGAVRLHGFLPEDRKQAIVARSVLHLNTSRGEGWGMCVLEAAALGVPTVAYDVDGLRDAVRDGQTGWLVRAGETIEDVTERAVKELADPVRRRAISAACQRWAGLLDWERSRGHMAALIKASVLYGSSRGSRSGAWIVSGAGQRGGSPGSQGAWLVSGAGQGEPRGVLAEGPVLDLLLDAHPDGGLEMRPATPLERLLGRAAGEAGDLP